MDLELKDKGYKTEKVKESIENIIGSNRLLSMSTARKGKPHINTAFYAFDEGLNLYILTPPETEHSKNIKRNGSVAVDIHDSSQEWSDRKQGIQIFGNAEKVEDPSRALRIYIDRYPELEEFAESEEQLEELDSEFYRITPDEIKVFDESRFGKETWIEVKVKQ